MSDAPYIPPRARNIKGNARDWSDLASELTTLQAAIDAIDGVTLPIAQSDITGLVTALSGKAALTSYTQEIATLAILFEGAEIRRLLAGGLEGIQLLASGYELQWINSALRVLNISGLVVLTEFNRTTPGMGDHVNTGYAPGCRWIMLDGTEYVCSNADEGDGGPVWDLIPGKQLAGLGNVDNTSDENKPVSTAQQTALDAKQATLVSGTNIKTVNSISLLGSGNIVTSGGGSSDFLSILTASEISITGATTATIGRMHVCSGTSVDYTVALPAASGNAGKFIGIRMSSALTRLVTIDANSTELIDGQQTRIMWAGESAILLCDGTGWTKIAGKSIPMLIEAHGGKAGTGGGVGVGTQQTSAGVILTLDLATAQIDPFGAVNTSTDTITYPRPGTWAHYLFVPLINITETSGEIDAVIQFNGVDNYRRDRRYIALGGSFGNQCYPLLNASYPVATGDTVKATTFSGSGTAWVIGTSSTYVVFALSEVAPW